MTTTALSARLAAAPSHTVEHVEKGSVPSDIAGEAAASAIVIATAGKAEAAGKSKASLLGPISGFTNYSEAEHCVFGIWKNKVEEIYKKHGFTHIHLRPLEYLDNLLSKGGANHEIYAVARAQDGSLTDLGIPFDRTVPLAIDVAQKMNELVFPYKRLDINYSYRGEHAQAGRFRAFYQADIDIVDRQITIMSDFQCVFAIIDALEALNVGDFVMLMNHIAIPKAMIAAYGVPKEKEAEVLRLIDKMDKKSKEEIALEIVALVPEVSTKKVIQLVEKMAFKGRPEEMVLDFAHDASVDAGLAHVTSIYNMLIDSGVQPNRLALCPGMIRGLDYYTGIVFETFLTGKEAFGSVASGGRYDDLVAKFAPAESQLQGVGGSIGLTRLFDIMVRSGEVNLDLKTVTQVLVAYRTESLVNQALQLASQLRATGTYVDVYSGSEISIKKQLKYADAKGIPFTAMVMDTNAFVLKKLTKKEVVSAEKYAANKEDRSDQKEFVAITELVAHWQTVRSA